MTSTQRAKGGFRFPLQKYADTKALYTNFRHLQDHLSRLKLEGVTAATLVFAGPNTNNPDRADIILDGSNDDVQINAAIADLAGNDMQLVFLEGDYDIQAEVAFAGQVILQGGSFTFGANGRFSNSGNLFIVQGMDITGGASGTIMITNPNADGLLIVRGNVFHDITARACVNPYHGGAQASLNAVVESNVFRNITMAGGGGRVA